MRRTACAFFVLACVLSSGSTAGASRHRSSPRPRAEGALFGAHVQVDPERTGDSRIEAQANFEAEVGRQMAVDRVYYGWDTEFLTDPADIADREAGRTIVVSWAIRTREGEIVKWRDIALGLEDDQIDRHIELTKWFGAPVYLIFNHEAERYRNGGGYDAGTSREFVRAFRHIRDRFEEEGVMNVTWVLNLLACTYGQTCNGDPQPPDDWYPGDAYVDVLAADGYNFYGCKGDAWRSFDQIFDDFYEYGMEKGKPMMLAEWGSSEDTSDTGKKANFLADAFEVLKDMPEIGVVSYFHGGRGCSTVWADSSTRAFNAFTTMALDPYFNPSMP